LFFPTLKVWDEDVFNEKALKKILSSPLK